MIYYESKKQTLRNPGKNEIMSNEADFITIWYKLTLNRIICR